MSAFHPVAYQVNYRNGRGGTEIGEAFATLGDAIRGGVIDARRHIQVGSFDIAGTIEVVDEQRQLLLALPFWSIQEQAPY